MNETATIRIERITAPEPGAFCPRLVEAVGRCPPEDVGGSPGDEEYLKAIKNPSHERHAEFTEWYDADFNPTVVHVVVVERKPAMLAKRWTRAPRRRKTA